MAPFPTTTYDFFPYAGLHRPVLLYSVPADTHIDDVTVVTTIDRSDGVVTVKVATAGEYTGKGKARLNDNDTDLNFLAGSAEATLRVPSARFWGPRDPHLYPLTITLTDGQHVTDAYSLDIGIRTVAVRGDRLLLNGQPVTLTGFGKHEDVPLHGRGLNLPMWIRDYELLKWVGANSYRTSHYPYAEEAMQLADRLGLMVINEIPAVGLNFEDADELTAQRLTQCRQQLRELIARDKNHPSTVMWSVANEPPVRIIRRPRCGRRSIRLSSCAAISMSRRSGRSSRGCRCGPSPISRPARTPAARPGRTSKACSPATGGPRWPRISCVHDGSRNEKEVAR
jgi:beta-glucuronidase